MKTLVLQLILAHILSDFIFQTSKMKDGKLGLLENQKRSKNFYLAIHSLTHAVMTYLIIGDWTGFAIPLVILITHFIIDYIKYNYLADSLSTFLKDQIAHLIVILIIGLNCYCDFDMSYFQSLIRDPRVLATVVAYIIVMKPTSILLGLFFRKWDVTTAGLEDAGCWIGYIERLLILTFVISNHFEAVGFLLAAKSVFRFGELKQSNEIKVTEYVLIGTFASFTIAVMVGLAVSYLAL